MSGPSLDAKLASMIALLKRMEDIATGKRKI